MIGFDIFLEFIARLHNCIHHPSSKGKKKKKKKGNNITVVWKHEMKHERMSARLGTANAGQLNSGDRSSLGFEELVRHIYI